MLDFLLFQTWFFLPKNSGKREVLIPNGCGELAKIVMFAESGGSGEGDLFLFLTPWCGMHMALICGNFFANTFITVREILLPFCVDNPVRKRSLTGAD